MKKVVCYNGGTESVYPCSNPSALQLGKKYEVTEVTDMNGQTNYSLNDVIGTFNSAWFDDVESDEDTQDDKPYYTAISNNVPMVGERFVCYRLAFADSPRLIPWDTSPVIAVSRIRDHIYRVTTRNSTYVLLVRHD